MRSIAGPPGAVLDRRRPGSTQRPSGASTGRVPGPARGALLAAALVAACGAGCARMLRGATGGMTAGISRAMLNHDDPETVAGAAPAYLLMADGLLADAPDDVELLTTAARMYGAYAGGFVVEPARALRLTERAFSYARRAACLRTGFCGWRTERFDEFQKRLGATGRGDVPVLHALGASWAAWIQARSDDWNAVAELPRATALMERVVELDEAYGQGSAHLYLGVASTILPPATGGKPEEGRKHFERAVALSGGKALAPKVLCADRYARLIFDRDLFERLLGEVLDADPVAPDLTLMNLLAQREARRLLDGADEFF